MTLNPGSSDRTPIHESFLEFVDSWNTLHGRTTPEIHQKIACWLSARIAGSNPRLLLMAFRAAGKSTLIALFCAWLLARTPDLRIAVVAAHESLARRTVLNVRRVIERHPAAAHLIPDKREEWGSTRLSVKRKTEVRDPSLFACGVNATITGARADVIVCDDVEVMNTSDTFFKRENLRERLSELEFVLAPGGGILYAGTPHTFDTIYTTEPRADMIDHAPFLNGYEKLFLPVIAEDGQSAWPERFPLPEIERRRATMSEGKFLSQMMLQPFSLSGARLNIHLLHRYIDEMTQDPVTAAHYIGGHRITASAAWWDPAYGANDARDGSVVAIAYQSADGHIFLHHIEWIKVDPALPVTALKQQIERVGTILASRFVRTIWVEKNGIGMFLPDQLRNEIERRNLRVSLVERSTSIPKSKRIVDAFEVPMAAGRVHAHASVLASGFADEMREWRPDDKGARDDGLDAAAGAISSLPPLRPEDTKRRNRTFFAKT